MRLISCRLASVFTLLLCLSAIAAGQTSPSTELVRTLPKTVGDFRAQGLRPGVSPEKDPSLANFRVRDTAVGTYTAAKGRKLTVSVIRTESQAAAYALLTEASAQMRMQGEPTKTRDVGIAGLRDSNRLAFYKGTVFVSITGGSIEAGENGMLAFARAFAATLEDIENAIPVLVKHLPQWETAQDRARYAVSLRTLEEAAGKRPVFEALSFDEGAEAVTADYGAARLVIVEFTTPQVAASIDERIRERIRQLSENGQPVPSVYRREGNYSVFVFDAPDETAATQLSNAVKYEQRVQWLGENPFLFEAARQHQTQQAVSLILGIAKSIGFFVALCLAAGGIVGGIAFLHRRTQQRAAAESYSDAGGMLRLNLDEMTKESDPSRLLASGDGETAVRP